MVKVEQNLAREAPTGTVDGAKINGDINENCAVRNMPTDFFIDISNIFYSINNLKTVLESRKNTDAY